WAILAALVQRGRTGQGTVLDVAMYDALYSMLTTSHALYLYGDTVPERVGNRHPLSTPFGCFATADGQVVIAVLTSAQFARLAKLIGWPGLSDDARFASDEARTQNEPELRNMIEAWSQQMNTEAAMVALAEAEIPSAPIWDISEATASNHVHDRNLVVTLAHDRLGTCPVVPQPVRFDGGQVHASKGAPGLSVDAQDVLTRFCGVDEAGFAQLKRKGVVL
ncbi:MAG: CoA transferase, partial [Pseudomonadota bacterium]